ncbi:DUF402 domain-containing protein [Occultella kanbiaonis]|uniref:DUF402 domain-containing protein n=1 Tax=Occultella kanbiaonis TaxID=2675754 RepID=UPI0013D08727|nr:DUF402 domain-containing protein [Occultella kanbiaonis]
MFDRGQAVIYRELWDDRVMTAMPMRIVADDGISAVLYLAAETSFQAARAPGGGPVRDLANWSSVRAVWTGGSLIKILHSEAWYSIDVEFDKRRAFSGYYVNFQEPVRRTASGFDTVDLVLDLTVDRAGAPHLKDVDDFENAVKDGHIASRTAERVWSEAERVRSEVERSGRPIDTDEWMQWNPPESWSAPTLSEGVRADSLRREQR